jgi:hypothetical protein
MNWRSVDRHCQSIWCLVWKKTETRQDKSSSTRWTDGQASFHPMTACQLTVRFWCWVLKHWMNWRCISSSVKWIVSMVICSGGQRLVAPDEPTPGKSIASDHLMVLLSAAFSQRLFGCLGLFIPPSLAHLRWLDFMDVQRSARHLEDHIHPSKCWIAYP